MTVREFVTKHKKRIAVWYVLILGAVLLGQWGRLRILGKPAPPSKDQVLGALTRLGIGGPLAIYQKNMEMVRRYGPDAVPLLGQVLTNTDPGSHRLLLLAYSKLPGPVQSLVPPPWLPNQRKSGAEQALPEINPPIH